MVWVVGENLTADRLRAGFTTRRGYVLSPLGPSITFQIEEAERALDLVVDGVLSPYETSVMHGISECSPTGRYTVLRSAGQNFDDAAMRLVVPATDRWRWAVEVGVVNGLDHLRHAWAKGRA